MTSTIIQIKFNFPRSLWLIFMLVTSILATTPRAFGCQQELPPKASLPRAISFPKPVEKTLTNGLRVITIERGSVPLVSAVLLVRSGGEVDPPALAGRANITATLLTDGGTKTRSAPELAAQIDALGAEMEASAGWDASTVRMSVMSSKFDQAMEIFSDVVRNPSFKEEEVDRIKRKTIDNLTVALSQPGTLASYVAARVLFGDAPYGHGLGGTPESISQIKRDDLVQMHTAYYRPENAVLVIGGGLKSEQAIKVAEQYFSDWTNPSAPGSANKIEKARASEYKSRVVVIDKPDSGQAAVLVTQTGIKRTDADYFRGIVMNSVLGGGYSARLNQEIRIKRGLSYGAGSQLDSRRMTGRFIASAQTKNESGAEVANLMLTELKKLAEVPTSEMELEPRKAVITGNFARNLETGRGFVAQIANLALYDLNLAEIGNYISHVDAIEAGDVQQFMKMHLAPTQASIVIVGNAKMFIDNLRKSFPQVEVISVDKLDLNQATLLKSEGE